MVIKQSGSIRKSHVPLSRLSWDYLTTIPNAALRLLADGLPLQNNLTKVPEAKVPAAIRWNNTAHTVFAFRSLDPI